MTQANTMTKERSAIDYRLSPVRSHHHLSFRCRDPEETRRYYEDFLGLEFTAAIPATTMIDGEQVEALQMMFRMKDGDFLTFYHVKGKPFDLPELGPLDRHLAMKLRSKADFELWVRRLTDAGEKFEGPLDHEFVKSVYWPDPNGIWLEFAYEVDNHNEIIAELETHAREGMDNWTVMTAETKKQQQA